MAKQIVALSRDNWENATNIEGRDRSSHAIDLSYNWAHITHTGGVYSNKDVTAKPGEKVRPFQFAKNGQKDEMLEFGIGDHKTSTGNKTPHFYDNGDVDGLFGDSDYESKRTGFTYHCKFSSSGWYQHGLYQFYNDDPKRVYPYPCRGVSLRFSIGKSQKSTTAPVCDSNYGDHLNINKCYGLFLDMDSRRYSMIQLYHRGRNEDITTSTGNKFKFTDDNVLYSDGGLTGTSHKIETGSHAVLNLIPYGKYDTENKYFCGLAIHYTIPTKSSYHCYSAQISRVCPIHHDRVEITGNVVLVEPSNPDGDIRIRTAG